MTITASSALSAALVSAAPATKSDYCSAVISAMSGARKIELLRNGVAQRSAPMTGAITTDTLSLKFGTVTGPVTGTAACNFGDGAAWTVAITAGSGYAYGFTWTVGIDAYAENLVTGQTGFGLNSAFSLAAPTNLPSSGGGGSGTGTGGGGSIIVSNSSTLTSHKYTFARWFPDGAFPQYAKPQIDGVDLAQWQITVKNRHASGYLKFAIFSVILPSVTTTTKSITFVSSSTAPSGSIANSTILASDCQCTVNVQMRTPTGTYPTPGSASNTTMTFPTAATTGTVPSVRSLLTANKIVETWENGPVKKTLVLRDDTALYGSAAYGNVITNQFVLEYWADGTYTCTVRWINGYRSIMRTVWFDITSITTGLASPVTRYSKTGTTTYPGMILLAGQAHVTDRLGAAVPPTINAKHGWQYFVDNNLLPKVRTDFTNTTMRDSKRTSWNNVPAAHKNLMGSGINYSACNWDEGTAGGRDEIGPSLHDLQMVAVSFGDSDLIDASRTHARLKAGWPVFFIENTATRSGSARYYDSSASVTAQYRWMSRDANPTTFLYEGNGYYQWGATAADDQFNQSCYPYSEHGNCYGMWVVGTGTGPSTGELCKPDYQHQANWQWMEYLRHGEYDFYWNHMGRAHWNLFCSHNNTETHVDELNNRASAWVLLSYTQASLMAVDGSVEQTYMKRVVDEAWVGHLRLKNQPLPAGASATLTTYYNSKATQLYYNSSSGYYAGANPLGFEYTGGALPFSTGQWWSWFYLLIISGWMSKLTGNIYAEQKRKIMGAHVIGMVQAVEPAVDANAHRYLGAYKSPALNGSSQWWTSWVSGYASSTTNWSLTEWTGNITDLSDGYAVICKGAMAYITDLSGGTAVRAIIEADGSPAWGDNPKWSMIP